MNFYEARKLRKLELESLELQKLKDLEQELKRKILRKARLQVREWLYTL